MQVLGIETTCDETAVAIVRAGAGSLSRNLSYPHFSRDLPMDFSPNFGVAGGEVLAHELLSQISEHARYGGVVPEVAARAHVQALDSLIALALEQAQIKLSALDAIAAAAGPGLIGGLLVGLTTAKALALASGKKFIAINHLEAHALTVRLYDPLPFPYLLLLVSGGHTQLLAVLGVGKYVRLGTTMDDSIGEAFDKTAKLLHLPYPGGPQIEQAAEKGNATRFSFPRPMMGRKNADFSLSGLKTAVRCEVARHKGELSSQDISDICASFQAAIIDVIVDRMRMGLSLFIQKFNMPTALVVAGGVASNRALRRVLSRFAAESGLHLVIPPKELCTDNGVMIAWAGIERARLGLSNRLDFPGRPRWPLESLSEE